MTEAIAARYSAREVVWLLSISYEDALEADAAPPDSFPDLLSRNFHSGSSGTGDDRPVPTVLRWHDVRAARERARPFIDELVLELRLERLSEHQIAQVTERSQSTVSRQWLSSIDEILRELGSLGS